MGPTYLVLLRGGDAAIVLYDGHDEDAARAEYERAYCDQHDQAKTLGRAIEGKAGIYLTTVRAEAQLS